MGQLISGLSLRPGDALVPELGFDLESNIILLNLLNVVSANSFFNLDAKPSNDELQLYNKLSSSLVKPGPALLHLLNSYVPASEQIRDAIAKPTSENELRAWDAVSPTVDILRDIYEYSSDLRKVSNRIPYQFSFILIFICIEEGLPKLLSVLCQGDVNKNLEKNQGLAKLFAELLDFVFEFDHLKVKYTAVAALLTRIGFD